MGKSDCAIKKSPIVFFNGKYILREETKLSATSVGLLSGWGVFESMRSYKNAIVCLDAHLERLKNSSRFCGIRC
ncbi:MAG: hypothetical protein KKC84_05095, partial [Candidatus Omnitrophica bacterium]|nr:hypothetical protein [Candidatus Omnitrophota bacterium]